LSERTDTRVDVLRVAQVSTMWAQWSRKLFLTLPRGNWTVLCLVASERGTRRFLKVLFVTPEIDDFIRVGGLAAVSAALPRALRLWSDVRVLLPGYRDVVKQFASIDIVGACAPLAEMPACSLGLASTKDGLPVYILLCPQLYDRPGNPYGDASGRV